GEAAMSSDGARVEQRLLRRPVADVVLGALLSIRAFGADVELVRILLSGDRVDVIVAPRILRQRLDQWLSLRRVGDDLKALAGRRIVTEREPIHLDAFGDLV